MSKYRVVFLGTPEFAAHHLQALIDDSDYDIAGVVSQPDRPAGRKLKLQPSAVKVLALENNLEVFTPDSMKQADAIEKVKSWKADAAIVVAYGQILTQDFLDAFPQKVVNVHGSLLPRWRGAAPIQRAIMAGDQNTGVCLQVMVKKLDAGAVIGQRECEITDTTNAMQLHDQLKVMGAELLQKDFKAYLEGDVEPVEQDESLVNYAHKLEKSESKVDWSKSSVQISQDIRGLLMGPGGYAVYKDKKVKLFDVKSVSNTSQAEPGTLSEVNEDSLVIQCADGALAVGRVQPESRAKMSISDFVRGYEVKQGDRFE